VAATAAAWSASHLRDEELAAPVHQPGPGVRHGRNAATADQQGRAFAGAACVSPGVYVCQLTDTGLAAQITVSGTKLFKDGAMK
jgi:hypothetical protein